VAIDMRGYGDSEKPSGVKHYRMNYLVDDIKQVVEALGLYTDWYLSIQVKSHFVSSADKEFKH
jgi:pimeloyl-ACP methyl ester carboxylesterase